MNQWLKSMNEWFKSLKQWLKSMILWLKSMNKWLKWPVLDICLGHVYVLDAHVRESCLQDVCVRNALCPRAGFCTMTCHCLRWLCARCHYYECISGVSVLYAVCIMCVCRIYILDVCVFDDRVAVVGVRHLCVIQCPNLKCLSAECLWSMSVWGMTVWL